MTIKKKFLSGSKVEISQ